MAKKERETNLEALFRAEPFFADLPDDRIRAMAESAVVREVGPGDLLASEDQEASGLYFVLSGEVKLYKMSPEGREQTLYVFGPGEPFGMCAVFEGGRFPAFAAALAKSRVAVLSAASFRSLAEKDPAILFTILSVMSRRLKDAMSMIESLSLREIPGRLAVFFLHESGGSDTVRPTMTQRELAKLIGATPEALSRTIKKMSAAGLLRSESGKFTLLDRQGLERCARGVCPAFP